MRNLRTRTLLVALLAAGILAAPAYAGPMAELQALNGKLKELAKQNASDAALKAAANQLIGYDLLAQNALRDHWGARSAVERAEYASLFRQLVEKIYLKDLRLNASYTVTYVKEQISGSTATVTSVVKGLRKGRVQETEVVYKMSRLNGRWVVHDMVTEDVSMEQTYRNSFNRILKDKGWADLIAMFKKKLAS
jgi:phospholipid transport system substrate-binding protein